MRGKWMQRIATVLLGAAWMMAAGGCSGEKLPVPDSAALRQELAGQKIQLPAGETLTVLLDHVSEFRVLDVIAGVDGETATAVLAFVVGKNGRAYQVEGVLSYEVEGTTGISKPYFEVNDIEAVE